MHDPGISLTISIAFLSLQYMYYIKLRDLIFTYHEIRIQWNKLFHRLNLTKIGLKSVRKGLLNEPKKVVVFMQ